MIILWTAAAFVSGSLMFSYWLGLIARRNLRHSGDGNPGAINLWRSAGAVYGMAGIVLDFLKGYAPAALLVHTGAASGYGLAVAGAAPILGHAFSPFLGWKGGKAIAVTFGVWSGLTHFRVSLALAVILAVLQLILRLMHKGKPIAVETDAAQVVFGLLLLSIYLFWAGYSVELRCLGLFNLLLLAFTHRRELSLFLRREPAGQGRHLQK